MKHPNADALELVTVLGWQVVTRVGEAKLGDTVVYCEIDSMLPGDAEWLPDAVKLRVAAQSDTSVYRIKTIKLRGELSQGLLVPLPACLDADLVVGSDVTATLGIRKYEPASFEGVGQLANSSRPFPSDVLDKTDENRVQSYPELMAKFVGHNVVATVKMDGMSGTMLVHPDTKEFLVCSRNFVREFDAKAPFDPYWYVAQKYNIESALRANDHIALQGEVCGPGIQQNLLGLTDTEFYVFNVIDIQHQRRLPHLAALAFCNDNGLRFVPVDTAFGLPPESWTVNELLEKAKGKYPGTKNEREGLVLRSIDGSLSVKVINNDYLLKQK